MTPPEPRSADPFARIAPHYDALMVGVPYAAWAGYVTQLAARAGRPILPGAKLLDLATGTGSVALQFAARGCAVTGIDRSQPMLAEAQRKVAQQGFDIPLLCRDLVDFQLPPEFDHALCLYDSLNYILHGDEVKRAFANVRATLKPDGLFIFDVNTVQALQAELFTQSNVNGAPVEYRWKSRYDPDTHTTRINMSFRVSASGEKFTSVHHQRAYTDAEIRSFLAHAGFSKVTAYEAYRMSPPRPQTDRVYYVATSSHPADP